MGRKVRVTTKCGETFTYDHDQEVDTVEVVEEPKEVTSIPYMGTENIAKAFSLVGAGYAASVKRDGENITFYVGGIGNRVWNELLKQKRRR